ncbi:hypothetical protein KM043_011788 [Ampulex compressa]|nr:hypothetical protein KM043_011788 [Ampulex compressa]
MTSLWILAILGCLCQIDTSSAELKFLQVIFRHGNRNPLKGDEIYPNDPYVNYTYPPEGYGALTNTGKMTEYKFGQYLHKRYGAWLGPIYSDKIVKFYASHKDRTVMSAELAAAALFPPAKEQMWNPALHWQPIPVWTVSADEDKRLFDVPQCPNFWKMRKELEEKNPHLIAQRWRYQPLYDYLSLHTGSNITQELTFVLRQFLFAQLDIGLTLEEWTHAVFPNGALDAAATYDMIIQSYTRQMKQLMGGIWLRKWLHHVDKYLSLASKDEPKAVFYAAHELNIAGILNALNCFDNKIPWYAASLMFELHEEDGDLYVKIVHKDKDVVRTLEVPGCYSTMCPLKVFRRIVAPLIPADPQQLCG